MINNAHIKKLLTKPTELLIKKMEESVQRLSPIKDPSFRRNVKYTLRDYIIGILDVLRYNISWNNYSGNMNGNTLRKKHSEWVNLGVYEDVYEKSFHEYMKTIRKNEELKYQSVDSTFIEDKNNSKESSYNRIYKRRKGESSKGIKINTIVTTNGIPLSVNVKPGNEYDSPILPELLDNIIIDCNTKKYEKHNRYKQYFFGDSGYDSKNNHNKLTKMGYVPIIKQNRRNIKNKKLIRKMNNTQKQLYKKRIIVENYHSWIKKFLKIQSFYEKTIKSYTGLLLLGISVIINRRIISNKK